MSDASSDPFAIYRDPTRVRGMRRWIEMVGALHRLGYGRLRLAGSWENAGPGPVWFGIIAPGAFFQQEHGGILARYPLPEQLRAACEAMRVNDVPMFTSRRASNRNYPWPGFLDGSLDTAAVQWVERYPQLAAEGVGQDESYVGWYDRMLLATGPAGVIAACSYGDESPPGYTYVSCGPEGVDEFELQPPGFAEVPEACDAADSES